MRVGKNSIAVLGEDSAEKYLGRKLAFKDSIQVEVANRVAAAWAAFHKHKQELCCKHYRLQDRCRLFDATVTPTLLYGCAAWALTGHLERDLKVQRRRMLRYVFRLHRQLDETWVDYVQRSAHQADELGSQHCMKDWIAEARRRKWRFAGQLARRTDNRWSSVLISWIPSWGPGRSKGRPRTRWSDQIEKYAGGNWQEIALNDSHWAVLEEGFASLT